MPTGTVKFFNEAKGFGFIREEGSGKEIFVHATALSEPIRQDDRVSYEVENGRKGEQAVQVRKL